MLCPDSLPHWPLCKCRRLLSSHISATHSSGNYLANRCFKNTGTGKISSGKWVISGMFIHPSLETPKVVFGAGGKGATRDGLCFTRCYLLYLQVLLLYIQVLLIYLQVLLHIQVLPTLPPTSNGTFSTTSKVMSGVARSCKENVGTYMLKLHSRATELPEQEGGSVPCPVRRKAGVSLAPPLFPPAGWEGRELQATKSFKLNRLLGHMYIFALTASTITYKYTFVTFLKFGQILSRLYEHTSLT